MNEQANSNSSYGSSSSQDLSSSNRSNAQFIGEDLLLITLSTKKQIIITDRNETPTIKRSFMLPFTFYRAQYIPTIKY
nr:hypothetical protein [Capnocytophaga sp. oral taxon 902]